MYYRFSPWILNLHQRLIGAAVRADFWRLYPASANTPMCCPSDDNRTKVTNSVTAAWSLWWHVGPYFWPADLTQTANPINVLLFDWKKLMLRLWLHRVIYETKRKCKNSNREIWRLCISPLYEDAGSSAELAWSMNGFWKMVLFTWAPCLNLCEPLGADLSFAQYSSEQVCSTDTRTVV